MTSNSYDKTNLPHKSLLTDKQISRLHKDFVNNSSGNTKCSKTRPWPKLGCLVRPLGSLLKQICLQ